MRADHPETPKQPDRQISWSIYLALSVSFCMICLALQPWELFPVVPGGGLYWIALGFGAVTGFVVNRVRPRYVSTAGRWRSFYDFLLKQLPPPD
jgi:hypothetical protein